MVKESSGTGCESYRRRDSSDHIVLWAGKKNGILAVAQLVTQIGDRVKKQPEQVSQLPNKATYSFDQEPRSATVLKTTVRKKVISRDYGKFQAKETGRCFPRETSLAIIVPPGVNYGDDIISAVGLGSFMAGRKLAAIKAELELNLPPVTIPYSSLYEQQ